MSRRLKGDTIIEVIFAIAIFSLIMIVSIGLMNNGLSTAQATLEATMTRDTMDTQAEILRLVHESYILERIDKKSGNTTYSDIWKEIISSGRNDDTGERVCGKEVSKAFVLAINGSDVEIIKGKDGKIKETGVYPRVNSGEAEGILVTYEKDEEGRYYDFIIQACWDAPGKKVKSELDTIVRFYDPEA